MRIFLTAVLLGIGTLIATAPVDASVYVGAGQPGYGYARPYGYVQPSYYPQAYVPAPYVPAPYLAFRRFSLR